MKRPALSILLFLLSALCCSSCSHGGRASRIEVAFIAPSGAAGRSFSVEVVSTRPERTRGLMFRKTMLPDQGMLFVFDRPAVHSFWMKNTFLALDMVFVSEDRKVVGILEDVPPLTETGRSVGAPSLYVLEFVSGTMKEHGIRPGYRVQFIGNVPVGEP